MTDIYGRNPVLEALRYGDSVSRVLVARGMHETQPIQDVLRLARENGVPVEIVERRSLDVRTENGVHQGVLAIVRPFEYASLEAILHAAHNRADNEPLLVLALDSVQDPQNLGTLLRTAEAAGVHGVLLPEHRAASVTPLVEKASAGAARLIRVAQVTNLVRALQDMKKAGAWVVGVENDPKAMPYDRCDLTVPLVLALGSEGRGLGRLVSETCDMLVRLPMHGRISSLNVAVAASIVLYETLRQRSLART